jgi:hypothetical protein
VIVMRLREGEQVSSLAPVVESGDEPGDEADGLAVVESTAEVAVSDDPEHDS